MYSFVLRLLLLLTFSTNATHQLDKVIIWGHRLHSHTHSYIHHAFYRTFQHLGYQTYHFDDNDNVGQFDFSNSLFITEGQVDKNIPLRDDCRYILHNCSSPKYHPFFKKGHCITLQVYTDAILHSPYLNKIDDCIYYDLTGKCIYMPWATDLLPHEIDIIKKELPSLNTRPEIWWVGTIGDRKFGNIPEIIPFRKACAENNIAFHAAYNLSIEENCSSTLYSYMAPAIVGPWQKKVGYIPCRIFKNISYGKMGITNSKQVYELFKKKIVYNPDTYQLFYDAKKRLETLTIDEIYELMDFVKNKHTYINRIETLLSFLQLVEDTCH